jgi:hypothetical protein
MIFNTFDDSDIVAGRTSRVASGFWPNGVTFWSSSLLVDNYWELTQSALTPSPSLGASIYDIRYTMYYLNVFPDATTYILTDTCDGVDHKHKLVEATADIKGTLLDFSGMLLGKVYRVTGDSWAGTDANAPALLEVDLHYEIDRPGSRQEYIK